MASWRNYYRRKYRRYYRRKYGSSYGKRSYGQMKAAKQQADQASQVLNIPTSLTCKAVRAGNQERGTFALNIYDLLRKSEFYQSYANMYDEFKIDNIKVKLIPTKYNVTVGDTNGAGYQSFTVYTAWDRTGLNSKQLYLKADGVFNDNPIADNDAGRPNITGLNRDYIGKGDNDGLYCIVGSDITTYSSAESRQISVGQNSSITRWLKPKTLAEKSQWISTAQLEPWYYHYNETDCAYTYIPTYSDEVNIPSQVTTFNNNNNNRAIGTILSSISPAIANNPCFLEEDPTINFKPTLLVGLYPFEDGNSTVNPRAVSFNVETEVSVTFRGLRKSKVV